MPQPPELPRERDAHLPRPPADLSSQTPNAKKVHRECGEEQTSRLDAVTHLRRLRPEAISGA